MRRFLTPILLVLAFALGLAGCSSHPPLSGFSTEITSLQRGADGSLTATVQYDNGSVFAVNVSSSHHEILLNGNVIGSLDLNEPIGLPPQHNFSQSGTVKLTGAAPQPGEASYQINSTLHIVTYGDSKDLVKVGGSGTVTVK